MGSTGKDEKGLPISFAAVEAPTIMDKFGAMKVIRDSTYSWICFL